VWQRFLTIFAGPATNYLSAIVLALGLYTCHGVDVERWYGVARVMPDYDAHGKLEPGDRILQVNHVPLFVAEGKNLNERIAEAKGAPISLTVERAGKQVEVQVVPRGDKDASGKQTWRIGVAYQPQQQTIKVGVIDAARAALYYPVAQTRQIGVALYSIVFGSEKADPGGPIRMVEEFYRAFSTGIVPGIQLLMMLSVYLGLFNLLPIPALDGGRLVFLIYEMVTRRRANPKLETMVHMAGIMALGLVMLVVLYIDLRRVLT
jgi:regulator of sigma E protease